MPKKRQQKSQKKIQTPTIPAPSTLAKIQALPGGQPDQEAIARYEKMQGTVSYLIFLQALVAMLGSLYFSTFGDPVKNFLAHSLFPSDSGLLPCELCWFARILMYPLVVISFMGMMKEDRKFTDYVLPLSVLGMLLDIFHYSLQKFNWVNPFGCTLSNPCNALQVQYFGFITIPFLALMAFTIITILCLVNNWLNRKIDQPSEVKKGLLSKPKTSVQLVQ